MDQEERIEVSGRIVQLPDDRTVFLGRHPTISHRSVIRFTNGESLLAFGLSDEALLALTALAQSYSETGELTAIDFPDRAKETFLWTAYVDHDGGVTEPTSDKNSTGA